MFFRANQGESPLAYNWFIPGDASERERRVLSNSGPIKLVVSVGIQHPEKSVSENANFAGSAPIPISNYRHISRNPSKGKGFVATRHIYVI